MQRLYPDMRRDCGEAVEQFGSLNQTMFNAPAVIYICVDKILSQWSLYDIGAYSQSIVLAAMEQGLATVPAITLMLYPEILRKEMEIPDNLKLTIGIAIGYADKDNKINSFISSRDPIDESVHIFD
jgi:Nitroreductase